MKKALACTLVVLTFFISFSLFANVIAKDSVILNVSKSEVNLGEDIVVSINVDTNEKSLYAYTAKLSYDKDVFEVIDEDDFEDVSDDERERLLKRRESLKDKDVEDDDYFE